MSEASCTVCRGGKVEDIERREAPPRIQSGTESSEMEKPTICVENFIGELFVGASFIPENENTQRLKNTKIVYGFGFGLALV